MNLENQDEILSLELMNCDSAALASGEMEHKYLTFWSDHQLFGIPVQDVIQIIGMQAITEIPEFPHYARGIIRLRGDFIPVVDLRRLLGKPEVPYDERTGILITGVCGTFVGFIVDSVEEVADIGDEHISPPPRMGVNCQNSCLSGIAGLSHDGQPEKIVLITSAQRLLGETECRALGLSQQ